MMLDLFSRGNFTVITSTRNQSQIFEGTNKTFCRAGQNPTCARATRVGCRHGHSKKNIRSAFKTRVFTSSCESADANMMRETKKEKLDDVVKANIERWKGLNQQNFCKIFVFCFSLDSFPTFKIFLTFISGKSGIQVNQ